MTAPRSTLARAVQQVASYQRSLVHINVLAVLAVLAVLVVRTQRPIRRRGELLGVDLVDFVIFADSADGLRYHSGVIS